MPDKVTFRSGSPGHLAYLHLQTREESTTRELAVVLDRSDEDVDRLLAYPCRMGAIQRRLVVDGPGYVYSRGVGEPSERPAGNRSATVAKPLAKGWPTVGETKPATAAAPAAATPPMEIPRFGASRMPDSLIEDTRELACEAARARDEAEASGDRASVHVARELISAALPALEVKRLDVAVFESGRAAIELDGVMHFVPRELVARLVAGLRTGEVA